METATFGAGCFWGVGAAAKQSKQKLQLSGRFDQDIVTEIMPATAYWLAEDYHQQYFAKQGRY